MTRIEKIRSRLFDSATALIITSDSNRLYASGFSSSAGFMLVSKNECKLYLDSRYFEMAKIAKMQGKLQPEVAVCPLEKKRKEYISDFCESNSIKTLLCEDRSLTVHEYSQLEGEASGVCKISGMGELVDECRASKDEGEIALISRRKK